MIYIHIQNIVNRTVIASNITDFSEYKKFKKNKNSSDKKNNIRSGYKIDDNISVWLIAQDERDFIVSSKRFKILIDAYLSASKMFLPYYIDKIKAHSHTLRTLQGQMKSKLEGFATPKNFRASKFKEQKGKISKIISENMHGAAELICYLNKRIGEIEAHIEGFDLLYIDDFIKDIKTKQVNIKKVLQNIIAPFLDDFTAKGVRVSFYIKDDYAENNNIFLNYKMFNLALFHFFDNAVKYIKNYSVLDVYFEVIEDIPQIKFKMMSCRIEKEEIDKICNDGYSGINITPSDAGSGIGMFVMQKSLESMGMSISVEPNYACSENDDIYQYIENTFIIKKIHDKKERLES